MLGISRSTLYVWAGKGKINIVKVEGSARVSAEEIDRFVAEAEPAQIAAS